MQESGKTPPRKSLDPRDAHAPSKPPLITVQPMPPSRALFRDSAAIAAGATAAGEGVASLFEDEKREKVQKALPTSYKLGEEPSGPCAFEIAMFLTCAAAEDDVGKCQQWSDALKVCMKKNGLKGAEPEKSKK